MTALENELLEQLRLLTADQQRQVLDFTRGLSQNQTPPGTPGEVLLEKMGSFKFAPGELDLIARAIEEDCEKVDPDGW